MKYCEICKMKDPRTGSCAKLDAGDFCLDSRKEIVQCHRCGQPLVQHILYNGKVYCLQCFQILGGCEGCKKYKHPCAFEADTTLPKMVTQSFQQGNQRINMQVLNPELIEKTCKQGCECWQNDECMKRNYGICAQWEEKL